MKRLVLFFLLAVILLPVTYAQTSPSYMLAYSTSSTRSNGVALDGAMNLKGGLYIYTAPAGTPANFSPANITQVTYTIDGVTWSNTEKISPYDLNSGSAWNSTSVADGSHVITQTVVTTSGTTEIDTATFTIQNTAPMPPATTTVSFACTPSFLPVTFSAFVPAGAKGYTFSLTAGSSPLIITSISAPAGFTMDPSIVYPVTISPGDSQTFTIRFVPTGAGTFSGNVVFLANVPNGTLQMGVQGVAN